MGETLYHHDFLIEVLNELGDDEGLLATTYHKTIQVAKDKLCHPNAKHGIKIYKEGVLVSSAIVLASGGATGVYSDAALVDNGCLVVRCCNKLFCLSIPALEVNWVTEVDWATCFSIHQYEESYISHGELSIARINRQGEIQWSYSGADIFVCLYEGTPFEMKEGHIALTDFNGSHYIIDYDGNALELTESGFYKQKPIAVTMKANRPWWKFW